MESSDIAESSTRWKGKKHGEDDVDLSNLDPSQRINSGMSENSAWAKQNILTFDGGGIRGYYSLLHLQKLMEYVEHAEKKAQDEAKGNGERVKEHSSFAPCGEPRHVSHYPSCPRYLPCHYFDYIGGTSTGALITIMLARLRMPVKDCIEEYKGLAGPVFGNPRTFHQVGKRGVIFRKNKFSTTSLELAIKDVVRRRGEIANDQDDAMLFSTPKGLCRAIAFANRDVLRDSPGVGLQAPWIFRSYDHYHKINGHDRRPTADGTTKPRNPGQGTRFAAWKVARAATAAPMYFKALEIALDDGEILPTRRTTTLKAPQLSRTQTSNLQQKANGIENTSRQVPGNRITAMLTDGGFGRVNNPSEEVLLELRFILKKRHKRIGTWVSIGTARAMSAPDGRPNILKLAKKGIEMVGDPEPVHERMLEESQREDNEFLYYRFNEPNGLSVDMDEWKPRGSGGNSGSQTMQVMDNAFATWANRVEVVKKFEQCAEELVKTRRARAKESISRWERYALGKFYVCTKNDCPYDPDETWHYRTNFIQHLKSDHGIIGPSDIENMLDECEYLWEYKSPKL